MQVIMRFRIFFIGLARVRWGRIVCAAAAVVASLASSVCVVGARDRPSGPTEVAVTVCPPDLVQKPRLCAYFVNTAHEDVTVEGQATRDRKPMFQLPALDCPPDARLGGVVTCYLPGRTIHSTYTDHGNAVIGTRTYTKVEYGFRTVDVEYGFRYCLRLRVRRVSDGIVSVPWSDSSCVMTSAPPKPGLPKFGVTYLNGSHAAFATGQAARPDAMQIAFAQDDSVGRYDLTVSTVDGSRSLFTDSRKKSPNEDTSFLYTIDPSVEAVSVRLCAVNFSGTTCSSQLQSIAGEGSIGLPDRRPAVPVHRLPSQPDQSIGATGTLKPVRMTGEEFMIGSDLPGSDYQHDPISGLADDCRKRCDADGKCLAWTWVKPGVQNSHAMCWLKNAIPPSVKNENTTSGVKRGPAPVIK